MPAIGPIRLFTSVRDAQESDRTPDRRVAYIECGDPRGRPVLYCHGFPSSAREARLLDKAAQAAGARVIAPDRPGYRNSAFQQGRTITDWADDIGFLADQLGLERFAILGVSGGGPYALACAWRIPQRISGCALICPLGPVYLTPVLAQMNWGARFNLGLARRAPLFAQIVLGFVTIGLVSLSPRSIAALRKVNASDADVAELANPQTRHILDQTIADAMRDGARGARQDLLLYVRDWGIPLDKVHMRIDIWHGEADGIVPVSHTRCYATQLRHARIHCLPNEGHYSLPMRHAEEILRTLLAHSAYRN